MEKQESSSDHSGWNVPNWYMQPIILLGMRWHHVDSVQFVRMEYQSKLIEKMYWTDYDWIFFNERSSQNNRVKNILALLTSTQRRITVKSSYIQPTLGANPVYMSVTVLDVYRQESLTFCLSNPTWLHGEDWWTIFHLCSRLNCILDFDWILALTVWSTMILW